MARARLTLWDSSESISIINDIFILKLGGVYGWPVCHWLRVGSPAPPFYQNMVTSDSKYTRWWHHVTQNASLKFGSSQTSWWHHRCCHLCKNPSGFIHFLNWNDYQPPWSAFASTQHHSEINTTCRRQPTFWPDASPETFLTWLK